MIIFAAVFIGLQLVPVSLGALASSAEPFSRLDFRGPSRRRFVNHDAAVGVDGAGGFEIKLIANNVNWLMDAERNLHYNHRDDFVKAEGADGAYKIKGTLGMTETTRTFVYSVKKSRACPVCGESSYSKDGIHPQCAVQLADESRNEELQAKRKTANQTSEPRKSWNKQCPKCKAQLHVRRKQCDCGHAFSATKTPVVG